MFGLKPLLGLEPMAPICLQLLVSHANHSATETSMVLYVCMCVCVCVCVYLHITIHSTKWLYWCWTFIYLFCLFNYALITFLLMVIMASITMWQEITRGFSKENQSQTTVHQQGTYTTGLHCTLLSKRNLPSFDHTDLLHTCRSHSLFHRCQPFPVKYITLVIDILLQTVTRNTLRNVQTSLL